MAQCCAYQNQNPATRKQFPLLLDIQSDLLDQLRTTVVIPLCPSEAVAHMTISKLNPVLEVNGGAYTAITQDMAGIDRKQLGQAVSDLTAYRADIIAAIDFMLSGI